VIVGPLVLAILALHPTLPPAGPYRVDRREIVDSRGRPYLIRGTEAPPEAWTATALVTIRQRLNLNAIRISETRRDVSRVVELANRLELLAIVEDNDPSPALRANPNVLLSVSTPAALAALRASGHTRPALVRGFSTTDPNVIRQFTPSYADPASWDLPDTGTPVLVNGLDPGLDEQSPECAGFPADPGAATRLFRDKLKSFDDRRISWTISSFRPGRLIADYRYFVGTKLDDGWTCGVPGAAGLGMLLLAQLWNSDPHGLFAVNGDSGGYRLPIGGRATVYGPTLADRERYAPPGPLPTRLGNLSIRITDSHGVARLAPLLYAAAGWAHINFIVPADAAPGPAEIAVVRSDGTRAVAKAILGRVAPGLASASLDGRGIAKAWTSERPAWKCAPDCEPLPLHAGTKIRLEGTGFRSAASLRVMVGDRDARVVSFGPIPGVPGKDRLTIELPEVPAGETDVLIWADGVLSNIVRVWIETVAPRLLKKVHGPPARRAAVDLAPPR
jgi:uncharacterized protein (TIGR03437 family)